MTITTPAPTPSAAAIDGPTGFAITSDGLGKTHGDRRAVADLDLRIPAGVVCGLIGPNGAGKTTTIRMLLGLIRPSAGSGTVLGHPITDPAAYLDRVGALVEGPAFHPTLTARRSLQSLSRLGGIGADRVDVVLEQVGLADRADEQVRRYSLGMRQRLGIAAALLPDPAVLILDEPTNGLDPAGIREVRALLRELADGGTTVLVSSHLLGELEAICDHVVLLQSGRLVFQGEIDELLAARTESLRLVPERSIDVPRLRRLVTELGGVVDADGDPASVRVTSPQPSPAEINRAAMSAGVVLVGIERERAGLEDAFFAITDTEGA